MTSREDALHTECRISRWDGRLLPKQDRLDGYMDQIANSLFMSSLTRTTDGEFSANIDEIRFGRGRAVRFSSSPHFVTRLRQEVARTSEDTIVAGLHISGGVRVIANGVEKQRRRGDLVALLSNTEFCLETAPTHKFEMLSLLFDGDVIDKLVGRYKRQPLKLLGEQPAAWTLRDCLGLFGRRFDQNATPEELNALFRACEALVATVFVEDRDFMEATARTQGILRTGLFVAITNYMQNNIHDVRLSPARVATAFSISTRYLHKLFAEERTTFSLFLLDCRLTAVQQNLTLERPDHDTISAIAKRWGFSNRATFNRTFKQRFNLTPSQFAFLNATKERRRTRS